MNDLVLRALNSLTDSSIPMPMQVNTDGAKHGHG